MSSETPGNGDPTKIVHLEQAREKKLSEPVIAALAQLEDSFDQALDKISAIQRSFTDAIIKLDTHLPMAVKLAVDDPIRSSVAREEGITIIQNLASAMQELDDKHAPGNAHGHWLVILARLENVADSLAKILVVGPQEVSASTSESKVVNLRTRVAQLTSGDALRDALEKVLEQLDVIAQFDERLMTAFAAIKASTMLPVSVDVTSLSEEESKLLTDTGDLVFRAADALENDQLTLSFNDRMDAFRNSLAQARDKYLEFFVMTRGRMK